MKNKRSNLWGICEVGHIAILISNLDFKNVSKYKLDDKKTVKASRYFKNF